MKDRSPRLYRPLLVVGIGHAYQVLHVKSGYLILSSDTLVLFMGVESIDVERDWTNQSPRIVRSMPDEL